MSILFFLLTLSLNTSLHTHAQTLLLLAPQRATPSLSLKLLSPGRTLLKRGSLKEVLLLCGNANFFFSRIVSHGSPLWNLILGIGIGVGVVVASVETRLALLAEARE